MFLLSYSPFTGCVWSFTFLLSRQWHLRIKRGRTLSEETWSWRRDVRLCRSSRGKSRRGWLHWREKNWRERSTILTEFIPHSHVVWLQNLVKRLWWRQWWLLMCVCVSGTRASGTGEETTTWVRKTAGETEGAGEAEGRGETQRDREERGMTDTC